MNFIKFTNDLKTKENKSLVEAIQSGYRALHENQDNSTAWKEIIQIAEKTIDKLDTKSLYVSHYQDILRISYYDRNERELYADELLSTYECEGEYAIISLVEKAAYDVLPSDEAEYIEFSDNGNQGDESEYFVPDEGVDYGEFGAGY